MSADTILVPDQTAAGQSGLAGRIPVPVVGRCLDLVKQVGHEIAKLVVRPVWKLQLIFVDRQLFCFVIAILKDRPSVEDLEQTLGLEVSVARLRTSGPDANHNMAYRAIYIHSKLMIIDDVFITVGSANLNQRSMSSDSEINIAATGQPYAADLRQRVFALHYGDDIKYSGDPQDLPDVFKSWNRRMSKNQDVQQAGRQPMTGFLLPFEDHRSTATLYGSVSVPSTSNDAVG
jgi:phosphatidylserine/phosphatidylglycerophosphate/cardiolipin synthase-like enzyme